MFTRWTQHLKTEEEVEAFRKELFSAKRILEHLGKILEEDVNALNRTEQNERIYDLPNWDYRQAHKNGIRQAYTAMQTLINLDQQK